MSSKRRKHKGKNKRKGKSKTTVKLAPKSTTVTLNNSRVYCAHDPTLVCTLDGVQLYGATKSTLSGKVAEFDLVLNCTHSSIGKLETMFPVKYASLRKHTASATDEIVLDWPDGGSYPVKLSFWTDLFDLIKANNVKKLVSTCIGGHGRTGTSLAALIVANSDYGALEAMKLIRSHVCRECIETTAQERYLYDLEFEKTGVEPNRVYSTFTSKWGNDSTDWWRKTSGQSSTYQSYTSGSNLVCSTCDHKKYLHCQAKTDACIASGCGCNLFVPTATEEQTPIKVTDTRASANPSESLCICQHSGATHQGSAGNRGKCLITACDCDYFYPDVGEWQPVDSSQSAFASLPIKN